MSDRPSKTPLLAVIREAECIGCTKCIRACPVDAILGSSKQMHTVIIDECIGCKLCVEPCPVDCIDLVPMPVVDLAEKKLKAEKAKSRFRARKNRLEEEEKMNTLPDYSNVEPSNDKKAFIAAALFRAKIKKNMQGDET